MDHFVLTFRPKEESSVPQRQVSNAFQPRMPTINEYATLTVGTSSTIKHPLGTSSLDGGNYGAPACAIDSIDAILPSTSLSPLGFTKPLSGQPISVKIPTTNAVCTSWCEYTMQYMTYDPTIGMQVLPIPVDLLARFIIEEAIKADTPLQKLAHICLVKYSCYEKGSRESEVAYLGDYLGIGSINWAFEDLREFLSMVFIEMFLCYIEKKLVGPSQIIL
ncbi:hypothetical protein BofuT4_P111900.1 [Botrytis cinerea T4]|uniref:Uncharacterized protein n=1 Tax=Botryotinia fuckeliana (strain T4) TaxID=999810 RepID=G2Y6C5_BOTF4|nr:hypothetical protein BofuT4_P111900.1 [Botrytis cinerea T4]